MLGFNKDFEALKKNIAKYYQKHLIDKLLKKVIWGVLVVLSFSISIILAEYFLYLNSSIKTGIVYFSLLSIILFSVFWVFFPLLKVFSIIKSPHLIKISKIISREVPSISDEMINAIQLNDSDESPYSKDLVNASVSQKSIKLNATGFESSIKLQSNKKALKWAAIPLVFFLIIGLIYPSVIKSSTERLVGFDTNYSPPAPFDFVYKNQEKEILEFEDLTFLLKIHGKEIPQKAEIVINGYTYPLRSSSIGDFSFLKKNINEDLSFYFQSQGFKSKNYYVELVPKARIENINIECIYPNYLKMPQTSMNNLQNLNIPEGTKVKWFFNSKNTQTMEFVLTDSIITLNSDGQKFNAKLQVFNNLTYGVVCHNDANHIQKDTMFFNIKVRPDIHPKISVKTFVDSLSSSMAYFNGAIEDDQGFSSLYFYFSNNKDGPFKRKSIDISYQDLSQEFYYYINIDSFDTKSLYYYFMVSDNDEINGYKKTKTSTRSIKALNKLEKQALIKNITDSNKKEMEKLKEKSKQKLNELRKIREKLMQKERLDWLDKQLIKDMIKEQSSFLNKLETFSKKEQEKLNSPLMTEKLKDEFIEKQKNLQEMFNKLIPEELKELMEELQKMQEDLSKEESMEMLEKLEVSNEEISDELDRMAELLKQFEFEKSIQDIIDNLSELEKKQNNESRETLNNDEEKEKQIADQEDLKNNFDQIKNQLDDLDKINNELERSHNLKDHSEMENSIENKMEDAINDLKSGKDKKGGKKQKEAGDQIQNMKESMLAMQEEIASQSSSVDMALLEKLLDNLVQISFNQEELIDRAKNINPKGHKYKQYIQDQYNINEDLIVVEDSLTALSKRVAQLESFIMKELKKSKKNLKKSIEELTKRKTVSAKISQQRTMTSFNNLALMLSESLQQMQNQAASKMKGCQNCQKKNGNKPGNMSSLSKLQKQLEKQLKEMKEGKGKKGKREWNKGLAKSAIKQAKIRALLEELGNDGQNGKKGEGEDLKKIIEEMEQNEKDIVNNRIDENLFKRIQDINTRLLKAEKAMKEREYSEEREAVKASHYSPKIPDGLKKFIKEKNSNKDAYKSIPPELYPFYKDLVNKYFKTMK